MIKILSAAQIRKADQYTIQQEPISSIDLMERAARKFCGQFMQDFPAKKKTITVCCGPGNNGGDGLAIARILSEEKYKVHVYYLNSKNYSADFSNNLEHIKKAHKISSNKDFPVIEENTIIIDALYGSGLNKPLNGIAKELAIYINHSPATVLSVDIPSGSFADVSTTSTAVQADKVYTFQFPKLSFFFAKNTTQVNDLRVLDIRLHPKFIAAAKTNFYLLEEKDIASKIKPRQKFSHKGTYGHALIVAGSKGKMGAAVLASRAALRAGCGLVTVHIPECGLEIIQTAFPEAMCSVDNNKTHITQFPSAKPFDAIAIGPGMGTNKETTEALKIFLKTTDNPLIVDADGLNILSSIPALLKLLPKDSILTPHPKEFERLAGKWKDDLQKLDLLKVFSKKHKVITILKGAYTAICNSDGSIYFNPTGNPGMATAGSGDSLTGILCGLLAQGYTPLDTACIGVYLHGLAGDLALKKQSMESLVASDITNNLGFAFRKLKNEN